MEEYNTPESNQQNRSSANNTNQTPRKRKRSDVNANSTPNVYVSTPNNSTANVYASTPNSDATTSLSIQVNIHNIM